MSGIKLIVGLANPGSEYENTRHNAGEWFINEVARSAGASLKAEKKFHGLHTQANLNGHTCHLLIPTTFMNCSGQAVRALATFYKIKPEEILIVHDDVDLPVGIVKLKFDGGNGGHNGLKDIDRHLQTKKYHRLRIGVGRPPQGKDTADYVLGNPSRSERQQIDSAIDDSMGGIDMLLEGEFQQAMQWLHS